MTQVTGTDWDLPYSREEAAFPAVSVHVLECTLLGSSTHTVYKHPQYICVAYFFKGLLFLLFLLALKTALLVLLMYNTNRVMRCDSGDSLEKR